MQSVFYTNSQQAKISRVIPDCIKARSILRDLVWKELQARYRNALMGFLWAFLQPLMMMLILTFVFGFIFRGRIQERGIHTEHSFAVFLLCGLVPWQFMSIALSCATNSLLESQDLIKKIYFPRELIPLAAILNCLVNAIIGFVTLIGVFIVLEGIQNLGLGICWFPLIFAIQFIMVVGLGLLLSALNVRYRDVGYMLEVSLAFLFYATPIFYPLSKVMELSANYPWLYRLYMLNPMASLITAYRQALLENHMPEWSLLLWPLSISILVLLAGIVLFRSKSPTFADDL